MTDSSQSTLILDCTACKDPGKAGEPWRQADGLREWTVEFRSVSDPDHPGFDMLEAVDGEDACRCPECGARGRVWRY